MSTARGFTLLEVAVAIALLLILGALALPELSAMERDATGRAARSRVEATVAESRAASLARGEVLVLRASGKTLELVRPASDAGPDAAALPEPAEERTIERWEIPSGTTIRASGKEAPAEATSRAGATLVVEPVTVAVFLPSGECRAGAAWVLTVGSAPPQRATVGPWTGRVSWVEAVEPSEGAEADGVPSEDESEPNAVLPSRQAPARKPRRGRKIFTRATRRAAILLECVLAITIFVTLGLAVLRLADGASEALARAQERQAAADLARSAMARIESGLASPETLHGAVRDEDGREGRWRLDVSTEPSEFAGLVRVTITASRERGESFTLHQLAASRPGGGTP